MSPLMEKCTSKMRQKNADTAVYHTAVERAVTVRPRKHQESTVRGAGRAARPELGSP